MRAFTGGLSLVLCVGLLGLTGCNEDNESFIQEQKARVKGTLSGARGVQAETQEEFYETHPGVRGGAGMRIGPVPDQGNGYPGYPSRKP